MTTYIVSPAYIVSHIHTNKLLDKEGFIEDECNIMKVYGLDWYLKHYKMSKEKLCSYFTYITNSLQPIKDIRINS